MKILIVNTYDISGGAARAAYRLHKALQSIGIDSQMLVQIKNSDDSTVFGQQTKKQKVIYILRSKLDALPLRYYENKTLTDFSPAWFPFSDIVEKINASDADVVHLHWIAHALMPIKDLSRIKKPIVWSLHDMWAFTGGCHYDSDCGKYTNHCGNCPLLASNQSHDLSHRVFERKVKSFGKIHSLTIVGLSHWLSNCAENSTLLTERKIVSLPNPIDTHTFRPLNRDIARELLDLPLNKKLILFGADGATNNPRKGFAELSSAMHAIKSSNIELVLFGSGRLLNPPVFGFPIHYLGHIPGDLSLCILNSAVDVMVVPSIQENLSNSIMESMACGTPVVAFDIGGNDDMIDHQQNGYLATPYDPASLAEGIDWILNYSNPHDLSHNARQKVMETFEAKKVAQQYVELYKEVLGSK